MPSAELIGLNGERLTSIPRIMSPWREVAYLHDVCNCYNTQGNTDGSIAHAAPSTNLATVVNLYTYKFWNAWPSLLRGFGFYNNGGAAPAIVGGTFAANGTIVGGIYNVLTDGSGKIGTQRSSQTAVVTLSAATGRGWTGNFNDAVYLDPGWYALCVRFNPGLSGGELARGNFVYYFINETICANTFQMKVADQGAFNSAFPADLSAATFVAWNGAAGAGNQLAGLGDPILLFDRS